MVVWRCLKRLKKQQKKIIKNLKILGVTILTSLNKIDKRYWSYKNIQELVLHQAKLIKLSGCHGIVRLPRK